MTLEDKELLIKDLSARLPYNVWCKVSADGKTASLPLTLPMISNYMYGRTELKPYLRPMSSMTEEEIKYKLSKFFKIINTDVYLSHIEEIGYIPTLNSDSAIEYVNWLIENHFDYRGLIEKGLAIEAPEDMY